MTVLICWMLGLLTWQFAVDVATKHRRGRIATALGVQTGNSKSASELDLAAAGWQHRQTMIEVIMKSSCEPTVCTWCTWCNVCTYIRITPDWKTACVAVPIFECGIWVGWGGANNAIVKVTLHNTVLDNRLSSEIYLWDADFRPLKSSCWICRSILVTDGAPCYRKFGSWSLQS